MKDLYDIMYDKIRQQENKIKKQGHKIGTTLTTEKQALINELKDMKKKLIDMKELQDDIMFHKGRIHSVNELKTVFSLRDSTIKKYIV